MSLSVLDLFSIGLGPSSSHTVGPMRAARRFVEDLKTADQLTSAARVKAELFGSLSATGIGHGSDRAVILGLAGHDPETVDADAAPAMVDAAIDSGVLELGGVHDVSFDRPEDVVLHHRRSLPGHPNGMRMTAFDAGGEVLAEKEFYSVGGGFVVTADELDETVEQSEDVAEHEASGQPSEPYPFSNAAELLEQCRVSGLSIAEVMRANEATRHDPAELESSLLRIWDVMQECVENGCTRTETTLPGGLTVRRRAPDLRERLRAKDAESTGDAPEDRLGAMEWVNLYALAVNEENASGGRIVTAPTNGAAGIIPAVLHFYTRFVDTTEDAKVVDFLLTAGAIGMLYKRNASISGAEVGCQGEVGSACSMAAGALCAVLGGTPEQVENAAEIGIEHNLGLTCDPVGGLVQIPCIERNAMASVKAINAARLAMLGDGVHRVSLDEAIITMRETGKDMKDKYKETSRGGLAVTVGVNIPNC